MGKHMTVIIHIKVEDQPVQGLKGVKSRSSIFHLERIFVFFCLFPPPRPVGLFATEYDSDVFIRRRNLSLLEDIGVLHGARKSIKGPF